MAVGLLTLALNGCGPGTLPQITSVTPGPSQGGVHTATPITIVFNVPMNRSSVEQRLQLRSRKGRPPPGCDLARAAHGQTTGCHFVWSDGGRVVSLLHPGHPLATVTTYRVDLAGGITASSGAVNSLSHSWSFSTEGGPSVSSTFPPSGGLLGPDQALAVNFNRGMEEQSVAKAVSLTPQPPGGYSLEPNPEVAGRFLLEPAHPLQPGSTYTLVVSRAALDLDGNRLQAGVKVKFTVGRLGSALALVFPAGPSPTDYTEVLAASPPQVPGDPPALRVLASSRAGQHYLLASASPNGRYLATELAGNDPLLVTDLATGKSTPVLGSTASTTAVWSPNSQELAFLAGGALRVYTVASNQAVTLSAQAALAGPLAWRPDSEVLAAVATAPGTAARIALLSPALRAVTYLSTAPNSTDPQGNPSWGPQGSTLAFSVGIAPAPAVWVYDPADSTAPLRQVAAAVGQPIVFLSSGQILVRLASGILASLASTTGSETEVVGPSKGNYPLQVAVSTAARELAYTRVGSGQVQLYLANLDGTSPQPVTAFGTADPLDAGPPVFVGG